MPSLPIAHEPRTVAVPVTTRRPQHDPCDDCAAWLSHFRPDLATRACGCHCHSADPLVAEIQRQQMRRDELAHAARSSRQMRDAAQADYLAYQQMVAACDATLHDLRRLQQEGVV